MEADSDQEGVGNNSSCLSSEQQTAFNRGNTPETLPGTTDSSPTLQRGMHVFCVERENDQGNDNGKASSTGNNVENISIDCFD